MARLNRTNENGLLAALNNPLRRQILRRMRDEDMISPLELAQAFDKPVSTMAYHVRVLASCGAVTLVRVKPVRGAIKHFYRSSLEPPWARQIIDLEPWDGSRSGRFRTARRLSGNMDRGNDDSWTTRAADLATESTVLRQVLAIHPVLLTSDELIREIAGENPEFAERDAIERAVRDLGGVGLLHHHGELVLPTRAALHFNELLER